jgi:plasmid stabilization system protein ParE
MRVVLSRLALAELDEILAYIAERSPRGARNVEARLRHAFDLIARHPPAARRLECGRVG